MALILLEPWLRRATENMGIRNFIPTCPTPSRKDTGMQQRGQAGIAHTSTAQK